ncbi:hypothetical protein TUM4433_19920 [Shewanella schlegeliana]|nr:hypothetical protein TUM4433_19920 [Shewanella schlegeliana]
MGGMSFTVRTSKIKKTDQDQFLLKKSQPNLTLCAFVGQCVAGKYLIVRCLTLYLLTFVFSVIYFGKN